jgi:hypothetical protein
MNPLSDKSSRFPATVAIVSPLSGSLQPSTPFAALGHFAGTVSAR